MKNRFFVINKEKIYAYVVSIMTVVTIFFLSGMMNNNIEETEEVSSNDTQNAVIGEAVSTSASYMDETENKENMSNNTENNINTEEVTKTENTVIDEEMSKEGIE